MIAHQPILPDHLTIRDLSRMTGRSAHQLNRTAVVKGIKPIGRVGNANIYRREDAHLFYLSSARLSIIPPTHAAARDRIRAAQSENPPPEPPRV